jgi:hypothetical protein
MEVIFRHSSHILSSFGRLSNLTTLNDLIGHFEQERQKCQMSLYVSARYSMDARANWPAV